MPRPFHARRRSRECIAHRIAVKKKGRRLVTRLRPSLREAPGARQAARKGEIPVGPVWTGRADFRANGRDDLTGAHVSRYSGVLEMKRFVAALLAICALIAWISNDRARARPPAAGGAVAPSGAAPSPSLRAPSPAARAGSPSSPEAAGNPGQTPGVVPDAVVKNFDAVVSRGPIDLRPTLARIRAGQHYPHRDDGTVFSNRERRLPQRPPGYYREYVHPTAGIPGPGPQRVVIGSGGEVYYTPDHYQSFQQVKQ